MKIGVIRTDQWLEEDFYYEEKICKRLSKGFSDDNPLKIYKYLSQFGMYRPNRQNYEMFKELKKRNYWDKIDKIFRKYKKEWKGPDVTIYIFPMAASTSIFSRSTSNKSGVAFKDKLFLFLTPVADEKELEALFVHEYHHVCRIHSQNKKLEESTLLDSIILEGLAEHSVEKFCGKKYLASWCEHYTEIEILNFWERFLKQQIGIKKLNKLHDDILYGRGKFPKMAGYSAGFVIVSMYNKQKDISLLDSFHLKSERFISGLLK